MVTRDRVTWGTRVGTGATADGWRRQGFIGSWKRSEIGFGESCRTVNIRKTTESHTVNREMSCYVNSVTSKSLEEKKKSNGMWRCIEASLWLQFLTSLITPGLPPADPASPRSWFLPPRPRPSSRSLLLPLHADHCSHGDLSRSRQAYADSFTLPLFSLILQALRDYSLLASQGLLFRFLKTSCASQNLNLDNFFNGCF